MSNRKLLNIELGRVSAEEYKELPESGIVLVLDNIRSAHNVGSAFRTADSFKIDKVWLCGICAVPPSAEIHKSALGAEDSVEWEHVEDTMDAINALKPKFKEVVIMYEMQDMSYEEISAKLKVPVGTIRSRLFNARKELSVTLQDLI